MSFEKSLACYAAPTLAGMKSAGLFSFPAQAAHPLQEEICRWQQALAPRGISIRLLRVRQGRALVYVYREALLARDLSAPGVVDFLRRCGYPPGRLEEYLACLCERLRRSSAFPHEIGIFLGYPLEDVMGFITHAGQNYTCAGCWKAYGDAGKAKALFAKYKKCTTIYSRAHERGAALTRLTVRAASRKD